MNTTTMRTLIAAAALVVAATASAQTFKAEVPMAFQVAGKTMSPGAYEIRMKNNGNGEVVTLYNRAGHSSAIVVAGINTDVPKAWRDGGDPKMAFEHRDGKYELRTVWSGDDLAAHQLSGSQAPKTSIARTEIVTLSMVKVR